MSALDIDLFTSWLCEREHEACGHAGMCFHDPLAGFLSFQFGHVYGIDGFLYGPANAAYQQWKLLPYWAKLYVAHMERIAFRPVTGAQALDILADVELVLYAMRTRAA